MKGIDLGNSSKSPQAAPGARKILKLSNQIKVCSFGKCGTSRWMQSGASLEGERGERWLP